MTKKVKLHHRVKNFYHKNPFRKFYTLIIAGLIVANIFGLIFASDVYTYGSDHNNDWGGGNDSAENHWGLDLNNPEERQGPCDDGWHVPSRGERAEIAIARCNQPGNGCDPSSDLSNLDYYGNLNRISKDGDYLQAFMTDFGMSYIYWSSSPTPGYDNYAWYLAAHHNYIALHYSDSRSSYYSVRCLKNSIEDVSGNGYGSSDLGLTTNSDGDYELIYNGKKYTIAGSDLEGTYYRGANENTDNTTWVDPNEGNGYGYGYGSTPQSCTITVDGNEYEVEYESSYSNAVYSNDSSDSCEEQYLSCNSEGDYLGEWYSSCPLCTIEIDGSTEYIEDGDYKIVYSSKLSESCEEESVYCYGGDLGSWYSSCSEYGYDIYGSCESFDKTGWNTAKLETNEYGDYELTYDGTTYTLASNDIRSYDDQTVLYLRGINTAYRSKGWGGRNDTAENGYDSGNPRSERQGPCEDGWHVPSRGEWAEIAIARCNQTGNSCNPSSDLSNVDSYGNINGIYRINGPLTNFFEMSGCYWSSSKNLGVYMYAWEICYGAVNSNYPNYKSINIHGTHSEGKGNRIRCLKNSIGEVSDTSALGFTTNNDGDYEVTYSGKKYTIAGSDIDGYYLRSTGEPLKYGIENNNAWGGGNDTVENGYDSLNPRSERQGPCEDGWHVPSRGEWNSIVNAWCHLSSNDCTSCDLKHADDRTESNNLIYVYNSGYYGLGTAFKNSFRMSNNSYWSSSPSPDNDNNAWSLSVYDSYIYPNSDYSRIKRYLVRCLKDTVEDGGNGYGYGYGGEEPETDALIIPTRDNYEVNVGGYTYEDELPDSMIVTTNNVVEHVENETVLGEVSVNFGGNSNATFTELMKIRIPVEGATRAVVKVKHALSEEYNYDGLTTNRDASCSNGRPTSNQYNGTPISVVNGYVSIYTCEASSFIAVGEGPILSQIIVSVEKGELMIGTETGTLDLGKVSVSNSAQELMGEFGENSFWVEDMKGVESGYYTTISVTNLSGRKANHVISSSNVALKTENGVPSYITGASVSESKVVFANNITSWYNTWTAPVTYFNRVDTPSNLVGRVGKWGDNLQVKVTIPAHTPSDIYKGTITYTLYDLDL